MVLAVHSEAKLHIKETPTFALRIRVLLSIARLSNGQDMICKISVGSCTKTPKYFDTDFKLTDFVVAVV